MSFPVEVVSSNLPDVYVDKLLAFIAKQMESTQHVHFYLLWSQTVLFQHGTKLKCRSASILPTTRNLQKNIKQKVDAFRKM